MARQLFGPFEVPQAYTFSGAANTPMPIQLPGDASWMLLQNDSTSDIWVAMQVNSPPPLIAEGIVAEQPAWQIRVRRQTEVLVTLQGPVSAAAMEQTPNTIGAFGGTIWVIAMPKNQRYLNNWNADGINDQFALPIIYIITGLPSDVPPLTTRTGYVMDMSNSPRVAAIPPVPTFHSAAFVNMTAGATWTNCDGARNGVNIGNYPNNNNAKNAGLVSAGTFWILIYAWTLEMDNGAASPFATGGYVRFAVFDSVSAMVATYPDTSNADGIVEVCGFGIGTVGQVARAERVYHYPYPMKIVLSANAGSPYTIVPQVKIDTLNGNPTGVRLTTVFDVMSYPIPVGPTGTLNQTANFALPGAPF